MIKKEPIIVIVGFLGAGKTTLLADLTTTFQQHKFNPFVILNDYENAYLDAQRLTDKLDARLVQALNGSCICCSGIGELRSYVNLIPKRENGVTLIEANGTSDACSLMGFLGVGIDERFLPPVQISVVDAKNWQKRGEHNELEANQVQVSSAIFLSHTEGLSGQKIASVKNHLTKLNPTAKVFSSAELNVLLLAQLSPSKNTAAPLNHAKAHWASCSVDLPALPDVNCINKICDKLPLSLLRVKGCTKIAEELGYTFFERTPDGTVAIRPYNGVPTTGTKLLTVGPGSEPDLLNSAIRIAMRHE